MRKASLLLAVLFLSSLATKSLAESEYRIIRALASAGGVAAVASIYGIAAGSSNIAWALDWTRFGYSDERSKRIQEGNGIAVGVETIIFCGFFPFWAYQYTKHYSPAALAAKAEAACMATAEP